MAGQSNDWSISKYRNSIMKLLLSHPLRSFPRGAVLLAAAGFTAPLAAAEWVYSLGPDPENVQFGRAMVWLGDVDGDAVADFAVSDPSFASGGTLFGSGCVSVISGADGSLIRHHEGAPAGGQYFGIALASLDADLDGVADLAVGASGHSGNGAFSGAVWIYSGADGSVLGMTEGVAGAQYGSALAAAGDQDGDGVGDLFVGAPGALAFKGQVAVQSGADGSVLSAVASPGVAGSFGVAVCAVGDSDGDGFSELAVGEPGFSGSAPYGGRVLVFRSSDQSLVATLEGAAYGGRLGGVLKPAPDADGDGRDDVMAGTSAGGGCFVISAVDGSVAVDLSVPELPSFQPLVPVGGVDLDGDGVTDWLVGSRGFEVVDYQAYGGVRGLSGTDGATILELEADAAWTGFGDSSALLPEGGLLVGESMRMDPVGGGRGYVHLYQVESTDRDGDGIPDAEDAVPDSINDPTVVIGGIDSGVENRVDDDGRTLADRYAELGSPDEARNHGAYTSAFSRLTNELRRAGILSRNEAKALHAAGVSASKPARGRR